jgi:hypothetical protein
VVAVSVGVSAVLTPDILLNVFAFLMGISLCTWSLWGGFSQHLRLLLEQLGQHLGLLLEQLGQQHLGYFVRTAASGLLLGQQLASSTASSLAS